MTLIYYHPFLYRSSVNLIVCINLCSRSPRAVRIVPEPLSFFLFFIEYHPMWIPSLQVNGYLVVVCFSFSLLVMLPLLLFIRWQNLWLEGWCGESSASFSLVAWKFVIDYSVLLRLLIAGETTSYHPKGICSCYTTLPIPLLCFPLTAVLVGVGSAKAGVQWSMFRYLSIGLPYTKCYRMRSIKLA